MIVAIQMNDLKHLTHRQCILFAIFCCKQKEQAHSRSDTLVIKVVEKWLKGEATAEDCRVCGRIAFDENESPICYLAYATSEDATSEDAEYAARSASLIANRVSGPSLLRVRQQWSWLERYSIEHIAKEITR